MPSLQTWTSPKSSANNDFGSRDTYGEHGAVLRDRGGDLCWLGNDHVPKTKVSAGPYKRLAPDSVRAWVEQLLKKNHGMLAKIAKFSNAKYNSTHGPVPAFATKRKNNGMRYCIFSYICVQRRWPMNDDDGTRI